MRKKLVLGFLASLAVVTVGIRPAGALFVCGPSVGDCVHVPDPIPLGPVRL